MEVSPTSLDAVLLVTPDARGDDRGFFLETYRYDRYCDVGIKDTFVQGNHSRSVGGVVRGLHFQTDPGQAKLLSCARGRILDVVVDVRLASPTYGKHVAVELDDVDHQQIYVPIGFAHGFCVLSDWADLTYMVSANYDADTESGIRWDDPDLGIDWPVESPILAERDVGAPLLRDYDWSTTVWQTLPGQ